MERAVIAMDVGGTTVDTACISAAGRLVGEVLDNASPSEKSRQQIVRTFADFVLQAVDSVPGYEVEACGIGMPGPFDYSRGISHMEHKFQSIKGVHLGYELEDRTGLPIRFVNDAAAFGLGVSWKQLPEAERIIALTIGTGLGASFIEHGRHIETDPRVPKDGELWNLPYKYGILEDVVSARGISVSYAEKTGEMTDAKTIADRTRQGDHDAAEVYRGVGLALGEALEPYMTRFQPEKIVIGGKVGRSLDLFGPVAGEALKTSSFMEPSIVRAKVGNLALFGAAKHAFAEIDI